jgi:hypothetical protein
MNEKAPEEADRGSALRRHEKLDVPRSGEVSPRVHSWQEAQNADVHMSCGGAIGVKRRTGPAAALVTAAGAVASSCPPVGIVGSPEKPDLVKAYARRSEGP